MRLFFALDLEPSVTSRLAAAQRQLRGLPGKINWVPEENMHVTMNFIGDVEDPTEICEIGQRVAGSMNFDEIELACGPLVCMPGGGQPRLLWMDVSDAGAMELLYEGLKDSLSEIGIRHESRAFRGHVTLARFKTCPRAKRVRDVVTNYPVEDFGHSCARELVLYSSELTRTGPIYTRVMGTPLGG